MSQITSLRFLIIHFKWIIRNLPRFGLRKYFPLVSGRTFSGASPNIFVRILVPPSRYLPPCAAARFTFFSRGFFYLGGCNHIKHQQDNVFYIPKSAKKPYSIRLFGLIFARYNVRFVGFSWYHDSDIIIFRIRHYHF